MTKKEKCPFQSYLENIFEMRCILPLTTNNLITNNNGLNRNGSIMCEYESREKQCPIMKQIRGEYE